MQEVTAPRYLAISRVIFTLILCAAVGFYIYKTIHWQVMCDTSIMHYINFLMQHGFAPYRDIVDINLPGALFIEGWAMHIFGGGDLGWRLYEFSVLGVLIASLVIISLPYDWFAGLYAGVGFMFIHAAEGPRNANQRDQVMVTLIMVGYAFLFTAVRRQKPFLLLPFGFVIGLAASLKPTAAPLGFILLFMATVALRNKNIKVKAYVIYGLIGITLTLLINIEFLYRYHAFGDFFAISKRLIPYYASVGNASLYHLLRSLFLVKYLLMLAVGLVLTFANRTGKDWERDALVLGMFFGVFSYLAQRKAFDYHAYPFIVFLLLWSSIEIAKAWRKKGWIGVIGMACFAAGVLVAVPRYVEHVASTSPRNEQPNALVSDLTRLGGPNLQNQVQCFDMVESCINALYRLQLIPYTTVMGDYMFFGPVGSRPLPYYRDIMWSDLHKNPPRVIVVTDSWLCEPNSFDKLEQWPEFASYLESAYTLEVTRRSDVAAYRIYLLKDGVAGANVKGGL